jgi:hypothetical protein
MSDFLIGAHAQTHAARHVSRDRGFYRVLFPKLELIDPSGEASSGKMRSVAGQSKLPPLKISN